MSTQGGDARHRQGSAGAHGAGVHGAGQQDAADRTARRWLVLFVGLIALPAGCTFQYGLAYLIGLSPAWLRPAQSGPAWPGRRWPACRR